MASLMTEAALPMAGIVVPAQTGMAISGPNPVATSARTSCKCNYLFDNQYR
jgi:hypothetical protein